MTDQPPPVMYRHRDAGSTLLYIGISDIQAFRIRHHHHMRDARWWRFVARIEVEPLTGRRLAAYRRELDAIAAERPIFNLRGNEDDQVAREEAYWQAHTNVPAWWFTDQTPPGTRTRPEFLPRLRSGELDEVLRRMGVGDHLLQNDAA